MAGSICKLVKVKSLFENTGSIPRWAYNVKREFLSTGRGPARTLLAGVAESLSALALLRSSYKESPWGKVDGLLIGYTLGMEIEVLYEDENKLVINKPVDLVVNRAESIRGETVQDWVEARSQMTDDRSQIGDDKTFRERSGVCHRLDKETSGCLLIAKNPETLRYFLKLFKDRKVQKEYLALVHGQVEPKEGSAILPLRRSILEREKWQVHYEGKKAITYWNVERVFDFPDAGEHWKNKLSLLKLDLKTGRTHQIRVHLSFLGWPIFGDERYLNKKQLEVDQKYLGHHFLHSRVIAFVDEKGVERRIEAPLPADCQKLLELL